MKKLFYKIIGPFRKMYWFVVRPKTFGVKCVVEHNGKFLMIRNSYGRKHWTFPGGKLKRGEEPEVGARRETREEVGLNLGLLKSLGAYHSTRQHKRDTVYCFQAEVDSPDFQIDHDEVEEAAWFALTEIPEFQSKAVAQVLDLLKKK